MRCASPGAAHLQRYRTGHGMLRLLGARPDGRNLRPLRPAALPSVQGIPYRRSPVRRRIRKRNAAPLREDLVAMIIKTSSGRLAETTGKTKTSTYGGRTKTMHQVRLLDSEPGPTRVFWVWPSELDPGRINAG